MNISIQFLKGYQILMVDNTPQSVYPPPQGGYWKHMIPDIPNFSPKSVLVLGVGGGTVRAWF